MDRQTLGEMIAQRIRRDLPELAARWQASEPVSHVVIDDLLPAEVADKVRACFPDVSLLMHRSSLRERKKVGVQLDRYDPLMGEILYAFQTPQVVAAVAELVGLTDLQPDPTLYASGLSAMIQGDFLNPHLDNSHDGDQQRYRALNLLYYCSPDWQAEYGGNLEVWDMEVKRPTRIVSQFNRLVLMKTDERSWHSVEKVTADRCRLCVSNYYFSPRPPSDHDYRHVTTFTGRPEETLKRVVLDADAAVLNFIGKTFPSLVKKTKHRLETTPPLASAEGEAPGEPASEAAAGHDDEAGKPRS